MDYIQSKITSAEANTFFGVERNSFPLNSSTLEATLRYIAISHSSEPMEKVKLFNVYCDSFSGRNYGNDYAASAEEGNYDICIYESRSGAELPFVDRSGWTSMDTPPYPVAPFLSRASATNVFVNTDAKRVLVFVKRTTDKWIDLFCAIIFRVLPWVFPNDNLTDQEKAFSKAINSGDVNAFTKIVDSVCKDYDFKATMMRKVLVNWGSGYKDTQIRNLRSQYDDYQNRISSKQAEINNLLDQLSAINTNLDALLNAPDEESTALFDFFQKHKQLGIYHVIKSSSGQTLQYYVDETIEYYDDEQFLRLYNNPSSFFCQSATPEVKKIFYAIFAQQRGVFRSEAMFSLTNLSSLSAVSGTRCGSLNDTRLPHPHIYHHACLGSNRDQIVSYMRSGDWDLAIEQSIAAAKNINFGDSVVIREMLNDVRNRMDTCRCIIADNGKEMTPREFLAYIETNNEEGVQNG